jgi:hypothetical protein
MQQVLCTAMQQLVSPSSSPAEVAQQRPRIPSRLRPGLFRAEFEGAATFFVHPRVFRQLAFSQELLGGSMLRALLPPCSAMSDGLYFKTWSCSSSSSSSSTPLLQPDASFDV